jgi:hypothetical protein
MVAERNILFFHHFLTSLCRCYAARLCVAHDLFSKNKRGTKRKRSHKVGVKIEHVTQAQKERLNMYKRD